MRPFQDFPGGSDGKQSACNAWDLVQSLGWEDPLEKGMATHSRTLAWRTPWTEEPGGLQSTGSQRIGHDRATNTFTFRPFSSDLSYRKLSLNPYKKNYLTLNIWGSELSQCLEDLFCPPTLPTSVFSFHSSLRLPHLLNDLQLWTMERYICFIQ